MTLWEVLTNNQRKEPGAAAVVVKDELPLGVVLTSANKEIHPG